MITLYPVWRFLKILIPPSSENVILTEVVDLGLLLLVPGRRPHLLCSPFFHFPSVSSSGAL